jgi:hypothetical protein
MTRKIVDILPPKKEEKRKREEKKIEQIPLTIQKKPSVKISFPKINWTRKILGKIVLTIFVFILVAIFLISFKFSKVEIKIWPNIEEENFVETIVFDTNAEKIDLKNKIIPAKIFETEEVFTKSFNSSGKILKKAEGVIRLFNEYTTRQEVWKEGTRFVSSDGKLFKSKDKIVVPGAQVKNGKIEASYVDVPVIADEGGSQYNIGPSEFSIIAFKGSPRYFKYYGKSFQAMSGGGEAPQVLKEDLARAEKELLNWAKEKAKEILKEKIGNEFSFLESAIEIFPLEKNSSAKEGDEKEKFDFQIKAKIKTLVFSKEDLSNFVRDYLSSNVSKDSEIYFPSLKTEFREEVKNFELGRLSSQIKISTKTYPKIDILSIKKSS